MYVYLKIYLGTVTGELVYVNTGTKEDILKIKELGIDLEGKIGIARFIHKPQSFQVVFGTENTNFGFAVFCPICFRFSVFLSARYPVRENCLVLSHWSNLV